MFFHVGGQETAIPTQAASPHTHYLFFGERVIRYMTCIMQ